MSIVENKKAYHDYFVEEKFEAGVALEGWEVKAIRAGRAQLKEAYVVVKSGEIVLLGAHITPLATASTHIKPDPTRTRKLLMHRLEINRLIGKVQRAGYTLTPLNLHFSKGRIKLEIGLARGKKQYDKRETEKLRDWTREKQRLLRNRSGANRASRSFGVMRSKPLNSRMLPQRLATWLSATRKVPSGSASMRCGIVRRLNIPWRKSLNTTARAGVSRICLASCSTIASEIDRLSSVSTLSIR